MTDVKVWYRGTRPETIYEDAHWSESKEAAGEFAAPAKVGGERGKIVSMQAKDVPRNLYKATNKELLAETLGIKAKPYSLEFDSQVKEALQARGFKGVHYSSGTFEAEELHLFSPKPVEKPEAQSNPTSTDYLPVMLVIGAGLALLLLLRLNKYST